MRAVIEIIIAVLVIIAVYFIIRGMDRHDVRIQQAATENETQRVWKEFCLLYTSDAADEL